MEFQYDLEQQYMQNINITDTGNTALCCYDEIGNCYCLLTKTIMGKTAIIKAGPIFIDLPTATENYSCIYRKCDYNEKTLFGEINKFINDPKKKIVIINEVTHDEALAVLPNVINLFMME